jgi:hypothetical protein
VGGSTEKKKPAEMSIAEESALYCSASSGDLDYAVCDPPKEAFMGGHAVPEISCLLCSKPMNLTTDLSADEHGTAVHEECYFKRIEASSGKPVSAIMSD